MNANPLFRRVLACFIAVSMTVAVASPAFAEPDADAPQAHNVIVMIADGMGPTYPTLARLFTDEQRLAMDPYQVGAAITHSDDRIVTDSAAAATAIATGVRTTYLYTGVGPDEQPLATLLQAGAAQRGMATGSVVTCRITHATPASFAAHVVHRWDEDTISAQMLETGVDLILGGGRDFFLPEDQGGRRDDGRDLLTEARAAGYDVLENRADFDSGFSLPALGVMAPNHLAYEIDRDPDAEPSLTEMTRRALELLSAEPNGFFLMIEGARIDHAGHSNDAAAALHDMLEYDRAFAEVIEFAKRDGNTTVVSVADHDTGGLALHQSRWSQMEDDEGVWFLNRVRASQEAMSEMLVDGADPATVLAEYAAIDDPSDDEIAAITEAAERSAHHARRALAAPISRRANVAWTTMSHTGVDVPLHAFGPGSERFQGVHPLSHIGRTLAELMGVDLEAETARVRERLQSAE